jgi:hypothetical protein
VPLHGLPHLGYALERPSRTDSDESFEFVNRCIRTCQGGAHACPDGNPPLLPDRVLDIGNDPSDMRLVEPKEVRAHYLTLSYCWGGHQEFTTDSETLAARKARIAHDELPPLFQDVTRCAQRLGIRYVWIDSLCILQDADGKDWNVQARKMGGIYGNSTLTIAAASAQSPRDRILFDIDPIWRSKSIGLCFRNVTTGSLRVRRRSHPVHLGSRDETYGPISKRAWIWQERLLAARTVFFTHSGLKFECHVTSLREDQLPCNEGHSWPALLEDEPHKSWTALMEDYTSREITHASDRLPALSSAISRIESRFGWSAAAGLWRETLVETLHWSPRDRRPAKPHAAYVVPTWSWASVDGPVKWLPLEIRNIHNPRETHWSLKAIRLGHLAADPLPGASDYLEVWGYLIPAFIISYVPPKEEYTVTLSRKDAHLGPPKEEYTVTLSRTDAHLYDAYRRDPSQGGRASSYTRLLADVPLQRLDVVIDGGSQTVAARASLDGPREPSTFVANCGVLLLASNRSEALCLVIAPSVGKPGSWERLGIVHGQLRPFEARARQMVTLV